MKSTKATSPTISKVSPNFTHLWERIAHDRVINLQGGTRSAKSWSVIDFLIDYCHKYKGVEIDIVRDTFTALKATAWKDFEGRLNEFGLYHPRHHNKTDHSYELKGNLISYYGADNPDKIHGRSRDILWINEAQQFPQETVDQLMPRTRHRIICDFNPALGSEHWLDPYLDKYPPLITTYKDNPHLTASQVEDIESRQGNAYWWAVYGSGLRAKVEGAIFTNWSEGEFDTSLPFLFGQDYGFSNDPSTLIKVAVDAKLKRIYCDELLYLPGLNTDAIAAINLSHCRKDGLIIADSAEPRLINELRSNHGLNIRECVKGANSVREGIALLQNYQLIVTPRSKNLKKELSLYAWHDRKSATPIDMHNHLLDSLRYAAVHKIGRPNAGKYFFG